MNSVKDSFSFYSSPLDLLRQAIAAAERLTKRRYKLLLCRDGERREIELCFYEHVFFHLLGFHKIKELHPFVSRLNKKIAYAKTVTDNSLLARIALSPSFEQIEGRLICACLLENALKNEKIELYQRVRQKGYLKSEIDFDYLLVSHAFRHTWLLFLENGHEKSIKGYFCITVY